MLLREQLLPHLADLYELTHETVHLAVLRGTDIVYVNKIQGHRATRSPSRIGAPGMRGTEVTGQADRTRRPGRSACRAVADCPAPPVCGWIPVSDMTTPGRGERRPARRVSKSTTVYARTLTPGGPGPP
ncbi:IclR family transcriptional regulator domain-containing protein [Streptomyces canus]|uniref:IclR family transcriptional regulator domain-containing protein n=1 Tax=Streptomyces canus TaxID=58343 RepID=UPI003F4BE7E5